MIELLCGHAIHSVQRTITSSGRVRRRFVTAGRSVWFPASLSSFPHSCFTAGENGRWGRILLTAMPFCRSYDPANFFFLLKRSFKWFFFVADGKNKTKQKGPDAPWHYAWKCYILLRLVAFIEKLLRANSVNIQVWHIDQIFGSCFSHDSSSFPCFIVSIYSWGVYTEL